MFMFSIVSFPLFGPAPSAPLQESEVIPIPETASSDNSDTKEPDVIDSFFYYASSNKYGATLLSVGLQMDSSQYTQFQIEGPALQTPVLLRFESAQYTTGKGGSFLRTGVGFFHKFRRPLEGMVYEPEEEFGLGMHYVYDWLNTQSVSNHVVGFDMYVAKIETVFKLTIEVPTDSSWGNFEPRFGLQAGFGGMVDLIP